MRTLAYSLLGIGLVLILVGFPCLFIWPDGHVTGPVVLVGLGVASCSMLVGVIEEISGR